MTKAIHTKHAPAAIGPYSQGIIVNRSEERREGKSVYPV